MSLAATNKYGGVGLVSAGWVMMSYAQMPFGPTAVVTGGSPGHVNWGNRIFMNMNEQAPMFFASLWTSAIFADPKRAAKLGAAYLGLRSLYAPVWLIFGGEAGCPNPGIAPITFTQYAINMYSTMAVILKLAFEKDISSFFFGYDALGVVAFTGAYMMYAVGGIVNVNLAIKGYFDESKRPKTA